MKNFLRKAGSVAVWAALVAYIAWAAKMCSVGERDTPAAGVAVTVRDSASLGVITPGMVKLWIARTDLIPANISASEVPLDSIKRLVTSRGFVRRASVYNDFDGTTHIDISQRHPVVRFVTSTGYDFFITSDGYVLPPQPHVALMLPLITGHYTPPFGKEYVGPIPGQDEARKKNMYESYIFLHKLINFVEYIRNDRFWSAYIEQINIKQADVAGSDVGVHEPEVELVPRAGNHVVMLGNLDGFEGRLGKLMVFYNKGLRYRGWDRYVYIDLRYSGQIVCR